MLSAIVLAREENDKKGLGLTHGLVTGAIPSPKLVEFQKERHKRMRTIGIYGEQHLAMKIQKRRHNLKKHKF